MAYLYFSQLYLGFELTTYRYVCYHHTTALAQKVHLRLIHTRHSSLHFLQWTASTQR